jgi:hypothetical protein
MTSLLVDFALLVIVGIPLMLGTAYIVGRAIK